MIMRTSMIFLACIAFLSINSTAISAEIPVSVGTATLNLPPTPESPEPVVRYEYDAIGNLTKTIIETASEKQSTKHDYDALGRRKSTMDAKSGLIQFGLDLLDQWTFVKDPRNVTTLLERNGLGELKRLTSPDRGMTVHSAYDAVGNLRTRTDARGVTSTYSYDELGRLKQVAFATERSATSRTINWTYDQTGPTFGYGIGRLTTASTAEVDTTFRYNAHGQITMTIQSTGGAAPLVVNTDYDTLGQVTRLTFPSGRTVNYAWTAGQPTALTLNANGTSSVLIDQITLTPIGAVQSWIWKLGGVSRPYLRVYDTSGRLVRQALGNLI